MVRYIGKRCKRMRRVQEDLFLTSKNVAKKCNMKTFPGVHGAKKTRVSNYRRSLCEKQKLCWCYGVTESYMRRCWKLVNKKRHISDNFILSLFQILESRLDNLVFRMGFAVTRAEARQLVSHKAVCVNDKVVNISSYRALIGDVISIKDSAKTQLRVVDAVKREVILPHWIEQTNQWSNRLLAYPDQEYFSVEGRFFDENFVINFYSR